METAGGLVLANLTLYPQVSLHYHRPIRKSIQWLSPHEGNSRVLVRAPFQLRSCIFGVTDAQSSFETGQEKTSARRSNHLTTPTARTFMDLALSRTLQNLTQYVNSVA
jgi:hypothetical protein